MEKHFLISESEKTRILNLHKNLLNEHGTMTEATTAVDKVTARKAIIDFLGPDIVEEEEYGDGTSNLEVNVNMFRLTDGSGQRIPVNKYNTRRLKEGILYLVVTKPKVFDMKDAKKMTLRPTTQGNLPNLKTKEGYVMSCIKGKFCQAKFQIPTPKGLPSSNIPNKFKKLIVVVRFSGSQWDDRAAMEIYGVTIKQGDTQASMARDARAGVKKDIGGRALSALSGKK